MSTSISEHLRPRAFDNAVSRILVVDDEQYMCDVCARTLQHSGYEVATTNDPDAAVRLLGGDTHFDLLLTDINMPGGSGLALAKLARERDPAIAIIIMTGFASKENLQQSVQRGVADFLAKPFELDQLRLAVDQALHKRGLLQDNLRLRSMEQLLDSTVALGSTLDLNEIGRTLLRVTIAQSGCIAGFVLVEPASSATIASHTDGELAPAGYELVQRTITQRTLFYQNETLLGYAGGRELHAACAVPLQAQGEPVGVLLLCDEQAVLLRPGVEEAIEVLATHAGSALRNAALYTQLGEAYTRLQDLDKLKGEFIAIASHELRTPLSIVMGYTMMVRDQAAAGAQRDYLQRVLENAQRIGDIIDDMMSLRHLDIGESQPANERVLVQDIVQQAYNQMRPIANERRQQMLLDVPATPLAFLTDSEKMLLILGHLVANAVRFTPEGGTITVHANIQTNDTLGKRFVLRGKSETAEWLVIEVRDTGIGIPEREQSRIFERFYQIADSLTRNHGGIGLGLAIVRELTTVLGGHVWVDSNEGHGSTFTLALPYYAA